MEKYKQGKWKNINIEKWINFFIKDKGKGKKEQGIKENNLKEINKTSVNVDWVFKHVVQYPPHVFNESFTF